MARYTDSKCRLCRREGVKLFLKGARCFSPKCPIERRGGQIPGAHGKKYSRAYSDYGKQLREKQKVKRLYGVLEKQFRRYYEEALKTPGNTGLKLLQLLETRLDNIVFRLHLAPSRSVARQLVSHGSVLVAGKKMDIPSYQVQPEQTITLTTSGMDQPLIKTTLEEKVEIPSWLKRQAAAGQIARLPNRDEMDDEINERLIIEYYSR